MAIIQYLPSVRLSITQFTTRLSLSLDFMLRVLHKTEEQSLSLKEMTNRWCKKPSKYN